MNEKKPFLLAMVPAFMLFLGLLSWQLYGQIRQQIHSHTAESLKTVLNTTQRALASWSRENQNQARLWANSSRVRRAAIKLLSIERNQHVLLGAPIQSELRRWLEPVRSVQHYQGYFIISPDGINLASSRDSNVGRQSLLTNHGDFLQRIWAGKTVMSLPQASDVPLPDEHGVMQEKRATMFVGAPIFDTQGHVIAAFTSRIDPARDFDPILQQGRPGQTGETYAFNASARMISSSRFDQQLRTLGLLSGKAHSTLTVGLYEHPADRPVHRVTTSDSHPEPHLTYMARSAIQGNTGTNLEGYPNYRGVKVIGAWLWDEELGMGITTEMEYAEAYDVLNTTRYAIIALTVVAILLLLGVMFLFIRTRNHILAGELRMRSIVNTVFDAIITCNKAGHIQTFNQAAERIFGYDATEVIGKSVDILVPDTYATGHCMHIGHNLRGRPVTKIGRIRQLSGKRKDGHVFPLEIALSKTLLDGEVLFISVLRDITDRKHSEASLKKLNRSLSTLTESDHALLHASNENELLHAICKLLVKSGGYALAWVGYAENDEQHSIRIVAHEGPAARYLDKIQVSWADNDRGQGPTGTAIREQKTTVFNHLSNVEQFTPWRDKASRYGLASSIALPLSHKGMKFGALNIYSDHGAAFDVEEVHLLEELANDLAFGISTLRTKEQEQRSQTEKKALQQQLNQAQKMEAIGHLTGGIAHDFNNILASILGYTGLAISRCVTDKNGKLAGYLNEVYTAGERARDLVAQMLSFSRGGESSPQPLSVEPLVKEVIKMLRATLPSTIHIDQQFEPNLPMVNADPVQLHQILTNLCINARDAMDGQGRLLIDAHEIKMDEAVCVSCHETFSGNFMQISIHDTGQGINQALATRIFDPFFTTKDVGKGSGMGLSVVHGIVHRHHGHIRVDSEEGQGSVFRVLLPIETEAHSSSTPSLTETVPAGLADIPVNEAGGSIMVVDDEPSLGLFLAELLRGKGYSVTVPSSSQEALKVFTAKPDMFDLVVTDQTMPGLTGTEIASSMLAIRPELPIILCTGYSSQIDEQGAQQMGIRAFMDKPLELETLLHTIHSLLQSHTEK